MNRSNYGVIESALSTSDVLLEQYQVKPEIWFPSFHQQEECNLRKASRVELSTYSKSSCLKIAEQRQLNPETDCIFSHGCWRFPTRFGYWLHTHLGIPWVSIPHGMLEPWSLKQKRWKKLIYFRLLEKKMLLHANCITATSSPEELNLSNLFSSVTLIPNGVTIPEHSVKRSYSGKKRILFMARLHKKKGAVPLTKAWIKSKLFRHPDFELAIAGFDDGELGKLQSIIARNPGNIVLRDAAYGDKKQKLFESSHYFILPSRSEGAPVSIIDAISSGLIPIITNACNLPDAFETGAAIRLPTRRSEMIPVLNQLERALPEEQLSQSQRIHQFAQENYSIAAIAQKEHALISTLLDEP